MKNASGPIAFVSAARRAAYSAGAMPDVRAAPVDTPARRCNHRCRHAKPQAIHRRPL